MLLNGLRCEFCFFEQDHFLGNACSGILHHEKSKTAAEQGMASGPPNAEESDIAAKDRLA